MYEIMFMTSNGPGYGSLATDGVDSPDGIQYVQDSLHPIVNTFTSGFQRYLLKPDMIDDRPGMFGIFQRVAGRVCALLLFCHVLVNAQHDFKLTELWRWARFTTEAGLPSNHVISVLEDARGVQWAMTTKGIAWFDNYHWNAMDSSTGVPAGRMLGMEADSQGNILLVIESKLYSGGQGGFHQVQGVDNVSSVVSSTGQSLWLVSHDTLWSYERGRLKKYEPTIALLGGQSGHLWKTEDGTIWLIDAGRVHYWDGLDWKLNARFPLVNGQYLQFHQGKNGAGIGKFFGSPGLWEWSKDSDPKQSPTELALPASTMALGPDGEAIVAWVSGEFRIRQDGIWSSVKGLQSFLRDARYIRINRNKDVWVCTTNGLYLYHTSMKRWDYVTDPKYSRNNWINDIVRSRDGTIWLASDGGVRALSRDGRLQPVGVGAHGPSTGITALNEDAAGHIWVGSGSAFYGAYRWDGIRWRFFPLSSDSDKVYVHKIQKDKRGRLWFLGLSNTGFGVSNQEPGAYCMGNDTLTHWGRAEGLSSGRVYAFAEGSEGEYWFGTSGGLNRYKNGRWTYWTEKEGLASLRVFALTVDHANTTWFADGTNGLAYIDGDDRVHYITTDHGLLSNRIQNIREDGQGRLWLATTEGISIYNEGIFANLDISEGLSNPNVWPFMIEGDSVFAGTIGGGLAVLHSRHANPHLPKVFFEQPHVEEDRLLIRWKAFSYAAEESPENIQVRYRLNNDDWSGWSTAREITYVALVPGPYVLGVQTKDLFGILNPQIDKLAFSVPLPVYRRPHILIPFVALASTILLLAINQIVRKRRHARSLRDSELRFRRMTEATFEGIVIHDQGLIVDANENALKLLRRSSSDVLQRQFTDFIAPAFRPAVSGGITRGTEDLIEACLLSDDHAEIPVEIMMKNLPFDNRTVGVMAIRDIRERKQTEKQLFEYQSSLQLLASELSTTEERERQKMATYLHDNIGHLLALAKMKLGKAGDDGGAKSLQEVRALIEETILHTRSLTFDLSPPIIYELNVTEMIEWLSQHFQERFDILIYVEDDGTPKAIQQELRLFLYHAVRELLINVVKHAETSSAGIMLRTVGGNLLIEVKDEGRGFAPPDHAQATGRKGFGLFSIKERLKFYGGSMEILSQPACGTSVILTLPLQRKEHP
jgi:PAS domain S-box-containing protein